MRTLTAFLHAGLEAAAQTTEAALVALVLVDHAVPVVAALVLVVLAHRAPEEAFAAVAAVGAVVPASRRGREEGHER